ncbi:MAG: AarF/UbiB family protein, partial [Clostridia bacterium]|nr:AarF/UbiB family protein [Clostridia bacterium]
MKSRHRTKRAREIIGVFLKYGVRSAADPALMRLAFEELGPTFVKIGQILSTRPDILPDSYIREFRRLQDDVRPEKFEDIRRVIEDDLHAPLDKLFTEFDEKAAASASLAEVHRARLPDGRGVLIKVQRPRARETMTEDIAILKSLSRLLGFLPLTNIISFSDMMQEIEQTARQELDFLNEAENIRKFRENNSGVRYITCPGVYDAYTTSNVLVMDYIDGISIGNAEALQKEGYDLSDMGTKLVRNYFRQVFEDGFFHADPHPGNILIAENKIAYIDFGIMGSISHGMQEKFNSFLFGIATNDVDAMTKAILRIGVRKNSTDTDLLYEDVGELYNKYISASLNDINVREIISEVFNVCKKNSISMPREMTMLGKGMITIEGVVARIAPEINV